MALKDRRYQPGNLALDIGTIMAKVAISGRHGGNTSAHASTMRNAHADVL